MRLYIDPGTGSMLFTILISVIGAALYSLRMVWIKLRFRLSGGKAEVSKKKTPFVIFSDNKRYWNVFDPICRELDRRGEDVLYITASPDDPALNAPYEHLNVRCIENENKLFTTLNYLNASVLLSTTPGLDVYQWKRSKDVQYYVHIPHAANDITLYRMFGIDYYDAVLLSGAYQIEQIRKLEKLRSLPEKETELVGITYMDEMAKRLEQGGAVPAHERTVLLAPSWGPSALFGVYGGRIIDELLKTDYHIIIRPHPQSFISEKEMLEKLMKAYPASEKLEWNRDLDNFEVLRKSDILVSDFSGVIFDFSLVYDKPVIYTEPKFDLGVYDAWWLKEPLWTISALERIGQELKNENIGSIKTLIDNCLADPGYAEGRKAVKAETWAHFGESAERTADYLINKYAELTERGADKACEIKKKELTAAGKA